MAKIRSEVSENLKWRLTDIFSSDEEFKTLLKDVFYNLITLIIQFNSYLPITKGYWSR